MTYVVETLLANAVVATLLAVVAFLATRLVRRPALRHAIWLLVLLRLVAPPMAAVPVDLSAKNKHSNEAVAAPIAETPSVDVDEALLAAVIESAESEPTTAAEPIRTNDPPIRAVLFSIWAAGSTAVLFAMAWSACRFRRVLHCAVRSPELQKEADRLAVGLRLRSAPPVVLLDANVPPMLWSVPTRIVLPTPFVESLDFEQRRTLLAHELAHYRRRDHWVRWIETLVFGVFWWLPTAWWARREMRRAEEECCDAWVLAMLPASGPAYGRTLVDALDFLAERRRPAPALASGMGEAACYARRLNMILHGRPTHSLPRLAAAAFALVGGLCLVFAPRAASEPPRSELESIENLEAHIVAKKRALAESEMLRAKEAEANVRLKKIEAEKLHAEAASAKRSVEGNDRIARLEAIVEKLAARLDQFGPAQAPKGAENFNRNESRYRELAAEKARHDELLARFQKAAAEKKAVDPTTKIRRDGNHFVITQEAPDGRVLQKWLLPADAAWSKSLNALQGDLNRAQVVEMRRKVLVDLDTQLATLQKQVEELKTRRDALRKAAATDEMDLPNRN